MDNDRHALEFLWCDLDSLRHGMLGDKSGGVDDYWDTSDWIAPEREYLFSITPAKKAIITEWLAEHPLPTNSLYDSPQAVIKDLTQATGIITLNEDTAHDFVEWFEDFIGFLKEL